MNRLKALSVVLAAICFTACAAGGRESTQTAETTAQSAATSVSSEIVTQATTAEETTVTETTTEQTARLSDAGEPLYEYKEGYIDECKEFIRSEKVNGIAIGMELDEVVSALGVQTSEEDVIVTEDGELISMEFCDGNVDVIFVMDNGTARVKKYRFYENSGAVTDSGIAIGNSREEVIYAYGSWISVYLSIPDGEYVNYPDISAALYELDTLRIGSWKYGTMQFIFDENDKVVSIYAADWTSI